MGPEQEARIRDILTSLRSLPTQDPEIGIAKAYLIVAIVSSLKESAVTYYHYPCFYNLHHSLELIVKSKFQLKKFGHYLLLPVRGSALIEKNTAIFDFFTKEELELLRYSDILNSSVGELRYWQAPHRQFSWDNFVKLVELATKLIDENILVSLKSDLIKK